MTAPMVYILVDENGAVMRVITTDRNAVGWAFVGYLKPKTQTIVVAGIDVQYKPQPTLDWDSMVSVFADDEAGRN